MCQSTECKARENVFVCEACVYEHEIASSGKGRGRTKCRNCRSPLNGYLEWMQKVTGAYCECGRRKNRRAKRCSICVTPAKETRACKQCGKNTANRKYCSVDCSREACRGSKIRFEKTQARIDQWRLDSERKRLLPIDNAKKIQIVDTMSSQIVSDLYIAKTLRVKVIEVAKVRRRSLCVCLCCGRRNQRGNCQRCSRHLSYYKDKGIKPRVMICKQCCNFFVRGKNISEFCSKECSTRHHKRNRRHRQRSDGFGYEAISVLSVIRPNCQICGIDLDMPTDRWNPDAATLDHIIPLSKGGSHSLDNVRCVCHLCNSLRGNSDLSDHEVRIKRVARQISKSSKKA